ncbi:Tetratricopeptide-like helical domain superfamily [Sesbania bispinosa]|nr:Tetratricopeptide-like helical domain superfamily [Sesbania bispinosa]
MAETSLEAGMLRPDMEFIATLYSPLNPEIKAEIGEASKKPQDLPPSKYLISINQTALDVKVVGKGFMLASLVRVYALHIVLSSHVSSSPSWLGFIQLSAEEWKSLFPIGASTVSPFLLSDSALGPLIFNPKPHSLTLLFSSTSLLPPLHLPPHLFPSRFLFSTEKPSILPSTASSVASLFGSHHENDSASYFLHNRIHILKYPDRPNIVVFFPTGTNDDKVGFFMLHVKDSELHIQLDKNGDIFRASSGSTHRILRISVNQVTDFGLGASGLTGNSSPIIGYLLASTLYSVYWFVVKHNSILERPSVFYLGGKVFKTCLVVHACWSPHILEESLVLQESGELFLFDMESCSSSATFKGTSLRVPWNDSTFSENKAWLSCEFSWHPRILIVARSDAVFLVDLRLKECSVTCLMKIETLRMYAPDDNERFLALSRAGPDHFYFIVASSSLLILCDVRKPLMPVLQWVHGIDVPCYINVLSLSTLRSHSKEDTFKLASESGFCIILGSFWNCEFNIFCYGSTLPFGKGSINMKLSKFNTTFSAWELPFEINLSNGDCRCGSCLLREDLSKHALPEWIDWQLKKEIVLGFDILSNDIAALLCEPDEHGGFTIIRLMSSGKFELQRYHASWDLARNLELEDCHEQVLCLDKQLVSCPAVTAVFEDVKLPASFHEVSLRRLWADLPLKLLQLAFLRYSECREPIGDNQIRVALEFLAVPDLPQLPPFFLRKSSPHTNDDIVGPVIPFPVLLVLNEFLNGDSDLERGEFSVEAKLCLKYNEVTQVASEIAVSAHGSTCFDDHAVSLADDGEETWVGSSKPKSFSLYRPVAFNCAATDIVQGNSVYSDTIYETFIFHVSEKSCKQIEAVGQEIFDDLCPIDLRFDAPAKKFEPQDLKAYNLLKRQMTKWQERWHQFRSKFINFGGNRCIWDPDVTIKRPNSVTDHEEQLVLQKDYNGEVGQDRQLEVEGSVVHIMKELASHPSAAQSLIEDDSLQLLFQMDAKGSLIVFSRYKEGLVPLHSIQLHRHAMLVNGSTRGLRDPSWRSYWEEGAKLRSCLERSHGFTTTTESNILESPSLSVANIFILTLRLYSSTENLPSSCTSSFVFTFSTSVLPPTNRPYDAVHRTDTKAARIINVTAGDLIDAAIDQLYMTLPLFGETTRMKVDRWIAVSIRRRLCRKRERFRHVCLGEADSCHIFWTGLVDAFYSTDVTAEGVEEGLKRGRYTTTVPHHGNRLKVSKRTLNSKKMDKTMSRYCLAYVSLSGSIPDTTIGKLSKLQTLDLSHNITGLPSDFCSLSSLKSLNLSSNRLSGSHGQCSPSHIHTCTGTIGIGAAYQLSKMESLKSPFLFSTPLLPSESHSLFPKTNTKKKKKLIPIRIHSSSVQRDPWSLRDGDPTKPRPKSLNPKKPLSDDNARRVIKGKARYLSVLRRNQGPQAQTPRWIKRTPEQMVQYLQDDRNGHLYGKHVVAAIKKIRALSQRVDGDYDMRMVMGSFVGKLTFREMCVVLKEQKGWRQVRDFFAWMKLQLSYRPSVIVYTIVLRLYGQVGKLKLAEEIFLEMLDAGCEPDEVACGTMLCSYARWGRHKAMLSFYSAVKERGIILSVAVFNFMLSSLQKKSLHREVVQVWRDMIEKGVVPNNFTYTVAISSLVKEGLHEDAFKTFDEMKNTGFVPEEVTYSLLINLNAKNGNRDEVQILYDDMRFQGIIPSNYTCATLISLYYRYEDYPRALSLFSEMASNKISADEVIYGLLIRIYGKLDLYEDACKTFEETKQLGLLTNEKTYLAMAQVHLTSGNVDKALEVIELMKSSNLWFSRFAYIVLLQCYVMKEDVVSAEQTFLALCKTGLPDAGSCNDMLSLYVGLNLMNQAKEFIAQIRGYGTHFDEELYRTVMKVYCKEGMLLEAKQLTNQMVKNESLKTYKFFHTFYWALCEQKGDLQSNDKLVTLEPIDKLDSTAVRLMLSLYLTNDNFSKINILLKLLLGYAGGSKIVSQFIISLTKNGEISKAESLNHQLIKLGCRMEEATIASLISHYGKQHLLKQAEDIFAEYINSSTSRKLLYNSMIDAYAKCGKQEKAYLLYKKATEEGCDLGAVGISIVVNALTSGGV